eukprot:938241-Prorocentrum_minimum.AAC.5
MSSTWEPQNQLPPCQSGACILPPTVVFPFWQVQCDEVTRYWRPLKANAADESSSSNPPAPRSTAR